MTRRVVARTAREALRSLLRVRPGQKPELRDAEAARTFGWGRDEAEHPLGEGGREPAKHAELGKLERLTLTLGREPIAMLATFLTPPGAFSYKTAFDERYARFSPGVLLQHENLEILADRSIAWSDSCASADHPMIDHIWRERRPVGRISIAVGGKLRRALFARLLRAELGRRPAGIP